MNQNKPGNNPEGNALMWTYIIYGVVVALSFAIGYPLLGFWGAILVFGTIFLVNFALSGWINRNTEYSIIERLGNFYKVVGPGLHWRLVLVDKVVEDPFGRLGKNKTVTNRRRKILLYTRKYMEDEKWQKSISGHVNFETPQVDYADVAGVDILLSFFGGVGKENETDQTELYVDIYKFVYAYSDVTVRLLSLSEGFVRSTLQKLELEEANVSALDLYGMKFEDAEQSEEFERSKTELVAGCREVGWQLEQVPFILQDNGVPEDAVRATHEAYTEKKKGEGAKDRFDAGTYGVIKHLMEPKSKGGLGMKIADAKEFFLRDKSLETLADIPNPTLFIGGESGSVQKVLDITQDQNQDKEVSSNNSKE